MKKVKKVKLKLYQQFHILHDVIMVYLLMELIHFIFNSLVKFLLSLGEDF